MNKKIKISFLLLLLFSINLFPQLTSSPYTLFGLGQVEGYKLGVNHALGGTGIAFKTKKSLNNLNPASYSGIDSLLFFFETGIFCKATAYSTLKETQKQYDGSFNYLSIGYRVTKWWANSIGITPYSTVGYNINSTYIIEGDLRAYSKSYTGSGGISRFYYGNSFKFNKNLAIGVNLSYIFGSITRSEILSGYTDFNDYEIDKKQFLNNFYLDYGLQFSIQPNNLKYSIGLIYGNKKELKTKTEYTLITAIDTINLENEKKDIFYIPRKYGIGISLEKSNKFIVGFDYSRNRWSDLKISVPILNIRDSERFSLGVEYTPFQGYKDIGLKTWYYRIGAYFNKSYLEIKEKPINSKAITFGFGIPLRHDFSLINFSFEIGTNGTTDAKLIKENYWLVYLNFTLRDLWFRKVKYD
ncbi:MAG: hypothetical protein JXB17_01235 [Bacteroidales bacterium]|nr:hypothetical protein [Bacteroidales bacterium]